MPRPCVLTESYRSVFVSADVMTSLGLVVLSSEAPKHFLDFLISAISVSTSSALAGVTHQSKQRQRFYLSTKWRDANWAESADWIRFETRVEWCFPLDQQQLIEFDSFHSWILGEISGANFPAHSWWSLTNTRLLVQQLASFACLPTDKILMLYVWSLISQNICSDAVNSQ